MVNYESDLNDRFFDIAYGNVTSLMSLLSNLIFPRDSTSGREKASLTTLHANLLLKY